MIGLNNPNLLRVVGGRRRQKGKGAPLPFDLQSAYPSKNMSAYKKQKRREFAKSGPRYNYVHLPISLPFKVRVYVEK